MVPRVIYTHIFINLNNKTIDDFCTYIKIKKLYCLKTYPTVYTCVLGAKKRLIETSCTHSILFVLICFVALRPKSTAMVTAGRSVHLITLFPGQA